MDTPSFNTPFEVKFLGETGVFEGYASVFNVTDSVNDIIVRGAFKASLKKFRAEGNFPPLLWQHDAAEPIGAWREMREDDHGLFVRGELFVDCIALAKKAHKLMRENVVTGLSIGYRVKSSRKDEATGARVLTEVDLLEVSMVTFPANEHARISGMKKAPFFSEHAPSEREFEGLMRKSGLSRRQAKGAVARLYRPIGSSAWDGEPRDIAALDLLRNLEKAAAECKSDAAHLRLANDMYRAARESLTAKSGFNPAQPRDNDGRWDGGKKRTFPKISNSAPLREAGRA